MLPDLRPFSPLLLHRQPEPQRSVRHLVNRILQSDLRQLAVAQVARAVPATQILSASPLHSQAAQAFARSQNTCCLTVLIDRAVAKAVRAGDLTNPGLRHPAPLSTVCPAAQIVSGSRDKTIKLWNTLGDCKYTIGEPDGHTEWVSCVRFSPVVATPTIVSAGWDRLVKVWNLTNCKLRANLNGHEGYINTVTVSPDGSLCASGGKVSWPTDPAMQQQVSMLVCRSMWWLSC